MGRLAYELLMDQASLRRLQKKLRRARAGLAQQSNDDSSDDDHAEDSGDEVTLGSNTDSKVAIWEERLQQTFLNKLELCSLSVEQLSSMEMKQVSDISSDERPPHALFKNSGAYGFNVSPNSNSSRKASSMIPDWEKVDHELRTIKKHVYRSSTPEPQPTDRYEIDSTLIAESSRDEHTSEMTISNRPRTPPPPQDISGIRRGERNEVSANGSTMAAKVLALSSRDNHKRNAEGVQDQTYVPALKKTPEVIRDSSPPREVTLPKIPTPKAYIAIVAGSTPIKRGQKTLLERHTAEYLSREIKRETLMELATFVKENGLCDVPERDLCLTACMSMIRKNLFRHFVPPPNGRIEADNDDDDMPVFDPRWPHISVVYECLLRLLSNNLLTKQQVDNKFCTDLVQLFKTEDPRERDSLKNALHKIYALFPSLRPTIRKEIQSTFEVFVNERQRHLGTVELLEVLGSIISGFATPVKAENIEFCKLSLFPLHRADSVELFHNQLVYCLSQIVEKDNSMICPVVDTIYRYFPWGSATKVILFMDELEEIMEIVLRTESATLRGKSLKKLIPEAQVNHTFEQAASLVQSCLRSEHFQVVERALLLWNNDHLVNHFFKSSAGKRNRGIFLAVERSKFHWHVTVRGLANDVSQLYQDDEGYQAATRSWGEGEIRARRSGTNERIRTWEEIRRRSTQHSHLVDT